MEPPGAVVVQPSSWTTGKLGGAMGLDLARASWEDSCLPAH